MPPMLSVAVMVMANGKPVLVVGLPESKPAGVSVKPSRLLKLLKVKPLPEPPLALNCWLKLLPTVAMGKLLGLMTSAGLTTIT